MKPKNNRNLGSLGEEMAAKYLQSQGFRIIERNFRKRYGEIDIVALENNDLVFVEVRTRVGSQYGTPEESVTPWKLQRVIHSANYYKLLHPNLPDSLRIDFVAINLDPSNHLQDLKLYRNITS